MIGGLGWPVLGVADLERSLDFYCGALGFRAAGQEPPGAGAPARALLTSEGRTLALELIEDPAPSAWVHDDLQRGMRHVGFKVDDIDRWAGRVRDAGAAFTMEPRDAFGDVRIAFFLDPDGAHLELVQGNVLYNHPWSQPLIAAERAVPAPRSPRFDHIALSVGDLERAIDFYHRGAGAGVIGQLYADHDPHGFQITYLQAGSAILELFSFGLPTQPNPWSADRVAPGLLRVGLADDDPAAGAEALVAVGGTRVVRGDPGAEVMLDPDGTPLEIARGPVSGTTR